MNDMAKAEYDEKLMSDKEYYGVKVGKFTISLKYVFFFSLGMFLLVLALSEEDYENSQCPTSYKIKKLGVEEREISEDNEKKDFLWAKKIKKNSISTVLIPKNKKQIFSQQKKPQIIEEEE